LLLVIFISVTMEANVVGWSYPRNSKAEIECQPTPPDVLHLWRLCG